MDWGRAKNILILIFLLLNLLQAYQLGISRADFTDSVFPNSDLREEMLQALRNKNIRVEPDVPRETPTLREITIRFDINGKDDPPVKITEPLSVEQVVNLSRSSTERVLALLPHADAYRLDTIRSKDEQVVMNQIYEKRPMFEVHLALEVKAGQVVSYTQQHAQVVESEASEEHAVLSAYRVIAYLAENVLKRDDVIQAIELGYHGQVFNSDTQILAPKWRIALESGDIYYVHALNGAVERRENNGAEQPTALGPGSTVHP